MAVFNDEARRRVLLSAIGAAGLDPDDVVDDAEVGLQQNGRWVLIYRTPTDALAGRNTTCRRVVLPTSWSSPVPILL